LSDHAGDGGGTNVVDEDPKPTAAVLRNLDVAEPGGHSVVSQLVRRDVRASVAEDDADPLTGNRCMHTLARGRERWFAARKPEPRIPDRHRAWVRQY
jgi:hypothetical protein